MVKYVLRRLLVAVPMLFGAMSIVFFAMRILPGDPCMAMMGDQATTEAHADGITRCSPLVGSPLRIFALLGLSMPVFWLGILLLIVFSLHLDIFPLIGGGDLDGVISMIASGEVFTYPGDFLAAVGDVLYHLTLPAFALGFTLAATVSRLSRSAMLEVISQDYIRTARAKGQGERAVVYKHAF